MPRVRPILVLAAAAVLGATFAAALPDPPAARAADDKDVKKAQALKAKRDAFRKKLKEAGKHPFFDLSYAADQKAVQETRWTQTDPPPFADVSEEKGGQFFAVWSPDITKGFGIEIQVVKYLHKQPNSTGGYNVTFEHVGMTCSTADKAKMIEGTWKDWMKQVKEPVEAKCQEPKKKKVGPADTWASVVGTEPQGGKRERRDFYAWADGGSTWIAIVKFSDKFLDDPLILAKAEEYIGTWKDPKAPN